MRSTVLGMWYTHVLLMDVDRVYGCFPSRFNVLVCVILCLNESPEGFDVFQHLHTQFSMKSPRRTKWIPMSEMSRWANGFVYVHRRN